jgi:plastocyanin
MAYSISYSGPDQSVTPWGAMQITSDSSEVVRITIVHGGFRMPPGPIPSGTTVVWTNHDSVPHVIILSDNPHGSGQIEPGHSYHYTFTKPGTYTFYAEDIPSVQGTITVTAS